MKQYIYLILFFAICAFGQVPITNPLFDWDPSSAPYANEPLDISGTDIWLSGYAAQFYDNGNPIPISDFATATFSGSKTYQPETWLYNSTSQEYFFNQTTYVEYVNSTGSYQVLFDSTGKPICFTVKNYTFPTYVEKYKQTRRSGSVKLNLHNFAREMDEYYGRENRINDDYYETDIVDIYTGMMEDGTSPGPNSGCQKQFLPSEIYVSRYARIVYGKTIILHWRTAQFYPYLVYPGLSSRNVIQSANLFNNIIFVPPTGYTDFIDANCQNAPDYCTYYFNGNCIYPSFQNIPCGTAKR